MISQIKKSFNQVKSYRSNSKYFVEYPPILTYLIINSHLDGCEEKKLTCFSLTIIKKSHTSDLLHIYRKHLINYNYNIFKKL